MAINAGQILNGKFRVPFSQTPATSRAVASWAADGLPPGLTINTQTGLISGAPTVTSEGSPSSLWPSYITTQDEHFVTKLSASSSYCIALNTSGEIVEGTTSSSPIDSQANANIRDSITGATGLSAGPWHLLAITSGGVVGILKSTAASGAGTPGDRGQITPPAGLTGVTKVSAGWNHSLALKSNGTVVAFGADDYGQSSTPAGLSNVVDIAAGQYFSVAVKADGTVVHWGASTLGTFDWITDPATLTGVALVCVGLNPFNVASAFAVKSNGTVVILLGNDLTPPSGLSAVSTVAAASNYVAGLKSNGTVVIWGDITTSTQNSVAALSGVVAIAAQSDALFAAKSDGTVAAIKTSSVAGIFQLPKSESELLRFSLTEGPPIIAPSQTFSGVIGTAFNHSIAFEDIENAPVATVSVTGLPSGLTNSNGTIAGTPTTSGTFTIAITATGTGGTSTGSATISISGGAPAITTGQSFTGKVGVAFSQTPVFTNGPVTSWAVSSGTLPSGLSLNPATGAITGTPTALGTASPSLSATGSGGTSSATPVAFTISAGPPIIAPSQSFNGTVATAFSQSISLTDATNRPATSWVATGLPAGLSINAATGAITGTPTSAGSFTSSATATGAGGTSAAVNVVFTISANNGGGGGGGGTTTPALTPQQDFSATLGVAFNRTPSILSGTPTSWYATGLPAWATINATTGAITGTPNYTGVNIVTVTAQDSSGSVSSASITLTTVSWNTLEVFIDPRARKILSRANTRSVMQKMFLKRDDLVNFQIVFVNDDQPFGLPSDFSVAVGIKASYASEDFIAFSDSVNGALSLASDAVQDLFADEPDSVEAIFEVKWEDEASASRSASLPVIIQNTILRGNTADPGTTTGGGGFTASGLSKYLAARQKILTGETAETTTLTLSEPLAGEAIFHRPLANNLPDHRGWITGVSAVSLGTEALVAGEDFVFYPDRQCFYFLNPETSGDIEIVGTASRNFINFGVTIDKSIAAASSASTLIDVASPDFEITSVSITSEDMGTETPDGFYFDRTTATLFLETKFTCSSARVVFKDSLGVEFQETFAGLTDASTISVPKSLSAASVVKVTLSGTEIGVDGVFTPFAVLEKTDSGPDILHLGWNYPTGYENGEFTISASKGTTETFVFTFDYWPGNAFELPRFLDNVNTLKIGTNDTLVVFDSTEQKLVFCQAKTGTLHYTATHKAYEGLANGGETLQVVAEIPGVFATTAGTGHHISTLRTLNPSQDWYNWWYDEEGIYFVQIVDDKNVVIYQDDSHGPFEKSRPGYTAEELKPLTLKLPFAALWSLAPRDDTSLFQEAFTPNFATTTFSSATYPELDDTQRYAAESMGAGKTITLSTNKTIPVRGVQGVNFTGPKPTYYAGGTVPYFVLATYKWFVVKCVNPNANPLLTANKNYLLCVNNTNFDNRAIMVNITNEGYNVAADLYEIKGGN